MKRGLLIAYLCFSLCILGAWQQSGVPMMGRTGGSAGGGGLFSITHVSDTDSGGENGSTVASITATAFSVTAGNLVYCLPRTGTNAVTFTISDTAGNTWNSTNTKISNATIGTNQLFYSFTTNSNASDVVTQAMSPSGQFSAIACRQFSKAGGSWHLDAAPVGNTASSGTPMVSTTFSTAQATELVVYAVTSFGGNSPTGAQTIAGTDVSGTIYANAVTADQWHYYLLPVATQTSIIGSAVNANTGDPWTAWAASFYAQ